MLSSLTPRILLALALCACLSSPGMAAKKKQINRCQVFVTGMSDDLQHKAGEMTHMIRKVMLQVPSIQVLDLADRLKAAAPTKTKENLEKAKVQLKSAKAAMREMEYATVIAHAKKAREAFEKMGGYLDPLARYIESILLVGVGHAMQGNMEEASKAFTDVLLLDSHTRLPKTKYEDFVLDAFRKVRAGLASMPLGSVSIKTDPLGANLYRNGKLVGVTPDSMDGIPAGRHFLVTKLPGYQNWGQVITVEAGNLLPLDIKLISGQAGSGFLVISDRAAQAVSDDDLRGEVLRLGQAVGMDWTVLGQLAHDGASLVLRLYLFEYSRARVVYEEELEMEASGYGEEEDIRRFGVAFMRKGLEALRRYREEGDPLAGRSGTEDWFTDDSAAAKKHRNDEAAREDRIKSRENESGDPLDDHDGTEDW
ncbi:MAG: PEGA domain-containing protein [Deltaproteobacteria bacterium]|nr:PEGA domain-containing protein [Deltaproteobacteria bacterium]